MTKGKSLHLEHLKQDFEETETEAHYRKDGNFGEVEGKLLARWEA